MENQLDELIGKQEMDAEELKVNLNSSLASTSVISHVNEKLYRLFANVSYLHNNQVKDVKELKVKFGSNLTSAAAIST